MTPLRPHREGGVPALREASAEPMAPELRIRTLGPPQVWLGEVSFDLPLAEIARAVGLAGLPTGRVHQMASGRA
jgi:hypothetical protein